MDRAFMAVRGTGISFESQEAALQFDFQGCDMQTELLPARLRRRTSSATKMAFAAAERACKNAGISPSELPVIFTSSLGESGVTDRLCSDIAHQHLPVSPTRFHNSVHNTASGYWSIAVGNKYPAMAMGGYHDGFALGLLESWSQLHTIEEKILLVCFEERLPPQMLPDNNWIGCATAFVLTADQTDVADAPRLGLPHCEDGRGSQLNYGDLSPALAAMPLLQAIKQRISGAIQVSPAGDAIWFAELLHSDG